MRREATVHELLHPEGVGHMEGLEVRGAAEFLPARAALLDALPDMRVTVEETVAQDDHVVVRWSVTATHGGAGLGFPATGKPVHFRGLTWLTFSGGRIVEGWDAWNQGKLLSELQGR